jgi:sec-independent protein translocase protein TatC
MPLLVYAGASVGLIRARQLAAQWRIAIVVIAVIAAAVTPTVDPVSMFLVMLPMILLYGFSIVGAAIAEGGHRKRTAAAESAGAST